MQAVLLDYGAGNLHSVQTAFTKAGYNIVTTTNPQDVPSNAPLVIIPGVGHFGQCATQFVQSGFVPIITKRLKANQLVLGICVGLQILFESSQEAPGVPGLGIFSGQVERIPGSSPVSGKRVIVPHMGWNQLQVTNTASPFYTYNGEYVYFVHSYYAKASNANDVIATVEHGDIAIPALVQQGSLLATQFHPEKSGKVGQAILQTITELL